MKLSEYLDVDLLKEMIAKKYINKQEHPTIKGIYLYNYSKSCQIDKVWNDVTCKCRGLIWDSNIDNICARPFTKFFNYEEIEDKSIIPDEQFDVYEKMDGSLGIMYWYNGKPYICTRGSFDSEQAKHATYILQAKYGDYLDYLPKDKTFLFEIIWKEDKHCVRYGDLDDLFLIAVINTSDGTEEDIYNYEKIFRCAKHYNGVNDWRTIRDIFDGTNREGFVVKFKSGYRMKMKYEHYFKLHFLKSMLSEKTILEYIVDNKLNEYEDILKDFDEEDRIYYNNIVNNLTNKYEEIENICLVFIQILQDIDERHAIDMIKENKYSGILFKMLRHQNYKDVIWKYIKKHYKN